MDRVVQKKVSKYRMLLRFLAGGLALATFIYFYLSEPTGAQYRIDKDALQIATVVNKSFDDYIPVRGIVEPKQTVFLDTNIGGQVEQIYVEGGETVEKGRPLLKLRNSAIELDIISREAQVAEQLNNLRNTQLSLEQDKLNLKREVLDVRFRLTDLKRQLDKVTSLRKKDLVSKESFEALSNEFQYYERRLELALERQETSQILYKSQLSQLEENSAHLKMSLLLAKKNIDNLEIKAPVDGYLTSMNVEIGEYVSPGLRLGRIDSINQFKVRAQIDEYYLARVQGGLAASYSVDGQDFNLEIDKVYPEVTDGQFVVDLQFKGGAPENIRRGQGLQLKLYLGESENRLLLSLGGFYQSSGGEWVFVLNEDGSEAVKRPVRFGRRNPNYLEVLEGLAENDRVVISSYDNLKNIDRLTIKQIMR